LLLLHKIWDLIKILPAVHNKKEGSAGEGVKNIKTGYLTGLFTGSKVNSSLPKPKITTKKKG
jgi:hypothetical protein